MAPPASRRHTASATWHETTHGTAGNFFPDSPRFNRSQVESCAPTGPSSSTRPRRATRQQETSRTNDDVPHPYNVSTYNTGSSELNNSAISTNLGLTSIEAVSPAPDNAQPGYTPAAATPSYTTTVNLHTADGEQNETLEPSAPRAAPSEDLLNPRPRKRLKVVSARMSYPRKRAITACRACRVRKTKCDNQRPTCGSCEQQNAECVYQDHNTDMSSFDPASLQILDRLNYSIQLIESQAQALAEVQLYTPIYQLSHDLASTEVNPPAPATTLYRRTFSGSIFEESPAFVDVLDDDNAATLSEALDVSANCSCTHIIEWPLLQGYCDPSEITTPLFGANTLRTMWEDRGAGFGRGVREEDVVRFVLDFLSNVHIKNPILNPSELKKMARQTSQHGFGWDGPSCLVLVCCALANLSAPFNSDPPGKDDVSYLDARDYATAESYYSASRKRIGLLDSSVIATQCYFLIGVYEMYSLRPIPAWLSFNRACTTFQAYLRTPIRNHTSDPESRRLEHRLYWSCLKSECEMRDEIDLPPTGLAKVKYPDIFPSPPGGSPAAEDTDHSVMNGTPESTHQRSWYYYLSEIACRRIANRISHTLFKTKHHMWHTVPLRRMRRIAEELEAQVIQWSENIPQTVAFEEETSGDELTYMLQARFLDFRERIWRPFLYLAIHHDIASVDQAVVFEFAQRALSLLVKLVSHTAVKHRHHGSWYGCRHLFTMSLILLAAVKSRKVMVPPDWRSTVELVLTCLKYWEAEAPDMLTARLTVLKILEDVTDRDVSGSAMLSPNHSGVPPAAVTS